jgi:hypothetical protein
MDYGTSNRSSILCTGRESPGDDRGLAIPPDSGGLDKRRVA